MAQPNFSSNLSKRNDEVIETSKGKQAAPTPPPRPLPKPIMGLPHPRYADATGGQMLPQGDFDVTEVERILIAHGRSGLAKRYTVQAEALRILAAARALAQTGNDPSTELNKLLDTKFDDVFDFAPQLGG